ncbi:Transient receptor potential cation channel subfamily C member 6 [Fasciola gigantica]|uniref:Transient receptor potential cation channel subfamily C member 6 n=1 Tax=Fasciola gigantica TaxID=46835 RepID=A0A504YGI5_FASGI|nr:Transient receptor potential cation channel subfamily C member 6 [Fasciola gigantica]
MRNFPMLAFYISIRDTKDSLILELQRLHTYQALSSSAYLALTTSDPVSTAFVLRDELYQLASQEKQFKEEYSELAEKCMDFAVSCIDLCRTSDEVHCLLRGDFEQATQELRNPLETVKIAIHSREKKFVAHPNCQHQLENLFYNPMFCMRDYEGIRRLQFLLVFLPLLPILYIFYLFFPKFKVSKFIHAYAHAELDADG